jgi:hypothetical protein
MVLQSEPSWQIFVVAHDRIVPEYLESDPDWHPDLYPILNVRERSFPVPEPHHIINQVELPRFKPLGPHWAESEAIYNVYRSGLHKNLSHIGFLQYDKELRLRTPVENQADILTQTHITKRVHDAVKAPRVHISFETHDVRRDYRQRIMADESMPETLQGYGRNSYDYILADYNRYFGTKYRRRDLFRQRHINLCSSFLIDTPTFNEMMRFFEWVVESGRLERFDTLRRHRLQGGLAERYFGVFLLFAYPSMVDVSIVHHDLHGTEQRFTQNP